jgi:ABC-type oligopeptide transport system substrate-binding subunit
MRKLLKAAAGASLLIFAATTVVAQGTPNTSSGSNMPGQKTPSDNNVKNEKPTDPNLPSKQPETNKLQKDERTGKSTGG